MVVLEPVSSDSVAAQTESQLTDAMSDRGICGHADRKSLPLIPAASATQLPDVAHRSGAGVALQTAGELAVEFADERPAVAQPKLRAAGDERLVGRRCGAVDDEGRRRCAQRAVVAPIVRPGGAREHVAA